MENEADWPQLSGTTGHIQNDWPVISGNTSSLYLKLWERNKCNFRDYQNGNFFFNFPIVNYLTIYF